MENPFKKVKTSVQQAAVGQQVVKRAEEVRDHVKENRVTYISSGASLATGLLIGAAIFSGGSSKTRVITDLIRINSPITVVNNYCTCPKA